ncbi:hypothetical protein HNY73_000835 [Argiope bruennichi]|uniref:Uncharacterized protein n=1 Tax=Argiope bruennichi TaxID=94029 RepID=A0A8T0G1S7_ARGBR|nr:hypothetical protein HNY73_000835 [Argiope bruennichi]
MHTASILRPSHYADSFPFHSSAIRSRDSPILIKVSITTSSPSETTGRIIPDRSGHDPWPEDRQQFIPVTAPIKLSRLSIKVEWKSDKWGRIPCVHRTPVLLRARAASFVDADLSPL